jgi:hypothetical protein
MNYISNFDKNVGIQVDYKILQLEIAHKLVFFINPPN